MAYFFVSIWNIPFDQNLYYTILAKFYVLCVIWLSSLLSWALMNFVFNFQSLELVLITLAGRKTFPYYSFWARAAVLGCYVVSVQLWLLLFYSLWYHIYLGYVHYVWNTELSHNHLNSDFLFKPRRRISHFGKMDYPILANNPIPYNQIVSHFAKMDYPI